MPVITVYSGEDWCVLPSAVLDALRDAAMTAWSLDATAITMLWHPCAAGQIIPPAGRGAHYCMIEIAVIAGRSHALKERLALDCIASMAAFDIPKSDIDICFRESQAVDWLAAGCALG